ncbi:hypothetical protein GCM10010249_19000 [Streptomyces roseolilacinus]|uniref:Uncharacterized protein n=1 Tax=Streptomyces roseolilacinus TaxID=66904 RepID=A0A918EJY1_9ACTN|nr:hypothetical protein GCM10010249_19000 [Streptomyces roseolilacinus]
MPSIDNGCHKRSRGPAPTPRKGNVLFRDPAEVRRWARPGVRARRAGLPGGGGIMRPAYEHIDVPPPIAAPGYGEMGALPYVGHRTNAAVEKPVARPDAPRLT